ncbi:hypothetical protein HMPREF1870_01233 [Bacteroidales bacterium KA00344]|nr:hypothetical protein HMPREF1870_01233 [Bacteroidales bacterium KA00344]
MFSYIHFPLFWTTNIAKGREGNWLKTVCGWGLQRKPMCRLGAGIKCTHGIKARIGCAANRCLHQTECRLKRRLAGAFDG